MLIVIEVSVGLPINSSAVKVMVVALATIVDPPTRASSNASRTKSLPIEPWQTAGAALFEEPSDRG